MHSRCIVQVVERTPRRQSGRFVCHTARRTGFRRCPITGGAACLLLRNGHRVAAVDIEHEEGGWLRAHMIRIRIDLVTCGDDRGRPYWQRVATLPHRGGLASVAAASLTKPEPSAYAYRLERAAVRLGPHYTGRGVPR